MYTRVQCSHFASWILIQKKALLAHAQGHWGSFLSPGNSVCSLHLPPLPPPLNFMLLLYLTLLNCILLFSIVYRSSGPLGCFLDELDTLLSSLPEDGTPVILLGDFNLPPESHQSSSVASLLQSFALTLSTSPATHKAGNQLDLVFTRSCSAPQLMVTPLHVSDHYFVYFSLSYPLSHSNNSATVTFRRNLRTLSFLSHLFFPLYTPSPCLFL